MATLNERNYYPGQFLLAEANGYISREEVTIIGGVGAIASGTVLGKITASGKYKPYVNTASDGSETVKAIALNDIPVNAADQVAVVIARHAEVSSVALIGNDAAGTTDLAALEIIVR